MQVGFDGQPTWSDKPDVQAAAEARALGATCDGMRVWSLYVPNGRFVGSPHYLYKLEWLHAEGHGAQMADRRSVGFGADRIGRRLEHRAHRRRRLERGVQTRQHPCHRARTAAFKAIVDAQFADLVRPFTPGPAVFTYWDYTQLRFPKNRGMRIDFILGSPTLAERVTQAEIVREERKGKAPSDHAPVLVELA